MGWDEGAKRWNNKMNWFEVFGGVESWYYNNDATNSRVIEGKTSPVHRKAQNLQKAEEALRSATIHDGMLQRDQYRQVDIGAQQPNFGYDVGVTPEQKFYFDGAGTFR